MAFAAACAVGACGGGGGGSSGGGAGSGTTGTNTPPPAPANAAVVYANSLTLGSIAPVSLSLTAATSTSNALLTTPVAAPLLAAGSNSLVSTFVATNVTGAGMACVSAASNTIGTVSGVNVGVDIKSVAALLDATWTASSTPSADWTALGALGTQFSGWENCGAKAEGAPSPSSTLTVGADGSFTDNVFDGNPGTTVTIVNQSFTAAQATALLSSAGYLDNAQAANPQTIRLKIYHNAAAQTVLVEQGIPASGATSQNPGFIALYVPH
nr:hypothetical protein HUO10_003958 [Paraburkholderia busanensis]